MGGAPHQSCMRPGFEPRWSCVGFSGKYLCSSLLNVTRRSRYWRLRQVKVETSVLPHTISFQCCQGRLVDEMSSMATQFLPSLVLCSEHTFVYIHQINRCIGARVDVRLQERKVLQNPLCGVLWDVGALFPSAVLVDRCNRPDYPITIAPSDSGWGIVWEILSKIMCNDLWYYIWWQSNINLILISYLAQ